MKSGNIVINHCVEAYKEYLDRRIQRDLDKMMPDFKKMLRHAYINIAEGIYNLIPKEER